MTPRLTSFPDDPYQISLSLENLHGYGSRRNGGVGVDLDDGAAAFRHFPNSSGGEAHARIKSLIEIEKPFLNN